jgi:hypothetical protein
LKSAFICQNDLPQPGEFWSMPPEWLSPNAD